MEAASLRPTPATLNGARGLQALGRRGPAVQAAKRTRQRDQLGPQLVHHAALVENDAHEVLVDQVFPRQGELANALGDVLHDTASGASALAMHDRVAPPPAIPNGTGGLG